MIKLNKKSTNFEELDIDVSMLKSANEFIIQANEFSSFSDSKNIISEITCLNCSAHPCTHFTEDFKLSEILREMPYNSSMEVCPVGAIRSPGSTSYIEINNTLCIGCNLCISRCSYGAIKQDSNVAVVNNFKTDIFKPYELKELEQTKNIDKLLDKTKIVHILRPISENEILKHYSHVEELIRNNNGLENHLIRNVFNSIGIKSKARAIGNNDIRFDLIAQFFEKIIVAEISINGNDILELPRAILDDFSVINSRYGIEFQEIIPVIVINKFPNKRSDFYEVLDDIKTITNIEIRVITYHFLSMLLRSNFKVDPTFFDNRFIVGKTNTSIMQSALEVFPALRDIDPLIEADYYSAIK